MAEYYTQRAGAGLILSEATAVTPQGVGYADTPGLWTPEQVQGWRQVTAAAHAAGGRIFAQLWHVGRISDPMFLDGQLPVAPSALAARGHVSHVRPQRAYVTPRALETAELPGVIQAYRLGAQMAQEAGFDGVEVHAANGYLLDQFLQDSTNLRNDDYGGPVENRAPVAGSDRRLRWRLGRGPRGRAPVAARRYPHHGRFGPRWHLRLRGVRTRPAPHRVPVRARA